MNRKTIVVFVALLALGLRSTEAVLGGTVRIYTGDGATLVSTLNVVNAGSVDYRLPSTLMQSGTAWSYYASQATWARSVLYMDYTSGTMFIDPKGIGITGLNVNWGGAQSTSAVAVTSGSSGPFVYASGTGTASVSSSTVVSTFPQATYAATPTTWQGRYGMGTTGGQFATSGVGAASTAGNFDLPWSFGAIAPTVNTEALVYTMTAGSAFRSPWGSGTNTAGNLVGTGSGAGMFYYTAAGFVGNQYSVVIPVSPAAVPEPSMLVLAGLGIAGIGYWKSRRSEKHGGAKAL